MMAHGHCAFNLAVGLSVGNALALPPLMTITGAVAFAGAGTLPDIDCAGSTASTVFGPFSEVVHHGSIELHHIVYHALYPSESTHSPHRGLTHWWPFWVFCGLGITLACSINQWVVMGVLAVLFALAARGLTIPDLPAETQGRFQDSLRHKLAMKWSYRLLNLNPMTFILRRMRKHTAKSRRYGGERLGFRLGIGKIVMAGLGAGAAYGLTVNGTAAQIGPWLGLLVGLGMLLHWMGDCPTHMGVPGFLLHQTWKLPFWASFYAGGPFEVAVIWWGLGWFNTAMLPHVLPRHYQLEISLWGAVGLSTIIIFLIITEARHSRKKAPV
jgi:hypothetical protein